MRPCQRQALPASRLPAHALQHSLAVKYALFNVYLTTVTLNTPPHPGTFNGRLSQLQGLVARGGRRSQAPQRWFWVLAPL